jgi:hypothetical protein
MSRNVRDFVCGFTVAWLLVAGTFISAPAAAAINCPSNTVDYTVKGYQSDGMHFGTKVADGNFVYQVDPTCARIAVITVYHDSSNRIQMGWFEDPTHVLRGNCPYPTNGTDPFQFARIEVNGNWSCSLWFDQQDLCCSAAFIPMNLHNNDISGCTSTNTKWSEVWTGTEKVVVIALNFCKGYAMVDTERRSDGDSDEGDFKVLKYMGASSNWNPWNSGVTFCDTDANYNNTWPTQTEDHIQSPGSTIVNCP